jgi:hypothetical protein
MGWESTFLPRAARFKQPAYAMRKGVPSGRDFRERLARTPSRVSSEVFDSSSILKSLVPHREEISSEESECDVFFSAP